MDSRIDLMLRMMEDMQKDIKELRNENAENRGKQKAFGGIGTWLNALVSGVVIAYVEWKFNRLN